MLMLSPVETDGAVGLPELLLRSAAITHSSIVSESTRLKVAPRVLIHWSLSRFFLSMWFLGPESYSER